MRWIYYNRIDARHRVGNDGVQKASLIQIEPVDFIRGSTHKQVAGWKMVRQIPAELERKMSAIL
jgi:hypothetical protein